MVSLSKIFIRSFSTLLAIIFLGLTVIGILGIIFIPYLGLGIFLTVFGAIGLFVAISGCCGAGFESDENERALTKVFF
jgi:hypothetical protein